MGNDSLILDPAAFASELRGLVESSRSSAARLINREIVVLHWQIGERVRREMIGEGRAEYGSRIVAEAAQALSEYGRRFGKRNLYYMVKFAEVFPNPEIVHALSAQLSWTHLRELIGIDEPLKRDFYIQMCQIERWSTRTLKTKIGTLLYERTAVAKLPAADARRTIDGLQSGEVSPNVVFKDPYLLDFLNLPPAYAESDLEHAILTDLQAFLLELGQGFSFIARQKRMSIGTDDFYLDLLFFHRPLRSLVAIELKLGKFDARDKGQMELYLKWLDRYERQPDENPPLGLILCADKNEEQIELLELNSGSIRVASYLTDLPARELLERRLVRSIQDAKARFE